jgi:hypothetical protein
VRLSIPAIEFETTGHSVSEYATFRRKERNKNNLNNISILHS